MGQVNELIEQVAERIRAHNLFSPSQTILVGVSGGVDSRVLLEVLARLASRPSSSWKLLIGHFNHELRGAASDADEQLVRDAAANLKLPVVIERGNVRATATEKGWSLEMAARELRHRFFVRAATANHASCVALAHHADDQVELFLLRLLRGAGTEGLAGMQERSPSVFDPKVELVRPFLPESKLALAQFATEEGLAFREDESNSSLEMNRNRIRHELVPILRGYQPSLTAVLTRQMEILRAEGDYLNVAVQDLISQTGSSTFAHIPEALQRRWLRAQLFERGITPSFDLIESLRLYPERPVSHGGLRLCRDVDGRLQEMEPEVEPAFAPGALEVGLHADHGQIAFEGRHIRWSIGRCDGSWPAFTPQCEWFDADKVGPLVCLRHWRAGDRFQPMGLAGQPKLQDLFTNAKVDVQARRQAMVATTTAGDLWWVEGLRIGERFKIEQGTRRRLKWEWD